MNQLSRRVMIKHGYGHPSDSRDGNGDSYVRNPRAHDDDVLVLRGIFFYSFKLTVFRTTDLLGNVSAGLRYLEWSRGRVGHTGFQKTR